MQLCLVSCNIRFDNPADGANAWPFRRELLARILLTHGPSLISTQEGRYPQLLDLESLLGDFTLLDHHRSWIGERMYPSIYLRNTNFEKLLSGDLWLSETPGIPESRSFDSLFPRLLTWALIQPKNTTHRLLVVNTHLDHVKPQTRLGQINVLIQEIKRVWDQQSHLIIMGDFNDSPTSEVRKILLTAFPSLLDAWNLHNQHEETSHHAFNGEIQNGSRIDWILVDKRLRVLGCFMDKTNHNGLYPTDHFPIICKLELPT
jgi:endonuclease/exonuclease/phosphatase family metal-dependent hydrolase